ncbi:site-specific integrase [Lachnospiraceae bacterium 29-84]
MSGKRRDSKNRILRNGGSQRQDGRYAFKYIDATGKQQFVYSWKLEKTDKTPQGKRDDICKNPFEFQLAAVVVNDSVTREAITRKQERAFLKKVTPHVCRHTFCSNMAKSGMNPKTLQYLMGHSDIGVTLNTYTHIGYDDAKEELERVENAE